MRILRLLWPTALMILVPTTAVLADDVEIQLGASDALVVKDSSDNEQWRLDERGNMHRFANQPFLYNEERSLPLGGPNDNLFLGFNAGAAHQQLQTTSMGGNVGVGNLTLYLSQQAVRNTALGTDALYRVGQNGTGFPESYENTAVGASAMTHTDLGYWNTAVGAFSLHLADPGSGNSALGAYALHSLDGVNNNSAFGAYSMYNTTTGARNSAVGQNSMYSNVSGNDNSAFGRRSMYFNSSGSANAAFGHSSLYSATTASENSAFGFESMELTTTGTRNVAVGHRALEANTIADDNVAIGHNALLASDPAVGRNTAVGSDALSAETTGGANTAVGYSALLQISGGTSNVALGSGAGSALTTGSNNVYIKANGGSNESNKIRIGTSINDETFIRGIHNNTATGGSTVLVNSSGELHTIVSSAKFKQEIRDMDEASRVLMDLRPVTFRYREETTDAADGQEFGLIAEEVAAVAPAMVVRDENGAPFSVRYHLLSPMLLNEVQRQERVIDEQRRMIDSLAARIEQLESRESVWPVDAGAPR